MLTLFHRISGVLTRSLYTNGFVLNKRTKYYRGKESKEEKKYKRNENCIMHYFIFKVVFPLHFFAQNTKGKKKQEIMKKLFKLNYMMHLNA